MSEIRIHIPGINRHVLMTSDEARDLYDTLGTLLNVRKPRRTKETDAERAMRFWLKYRARHPYESANATVCRIPATFPAPRPSVAKIRELLRAQGVELADPMPMEEVVAKARAARVKCPDGYIVVDARLWELHRPMFTDSDLRIMASGGLAKIGLAEAPKSKQNSEADW
jgi:hypothetical protein